MIIEKLKLSIKKSFSNYPKIKFVIYIVAIIVILLALITIFLRKTITLNVDGTETKIITYKNTVNEVLDSNKIILNDKDKISVSQNAKVSNNDFIEIKTAVPITINYRGSIINVDTAEDTFKDVLENESELLNDNDVKFDFDNDEFCPSLDTNVEKDAELTITNVRNQVETEYQEIGYDTIVEKDDSIYAGEQKVVQEGKNGSKQLNYNVVYKDDIEYSRECIQVSIVSEPQNKIIKKGTKQKQVSRGLNSNFVRELSCVATAYSGHSITATGSRPVRNPDGISTIAVDPSVIPLGSKVYVEGYGYAIAADTGGAIKGNKIDLFLNSESECNKWGRRTVKVYIISFP